MSEGLSGAPRNQTEEDVDRLLRILTDKIRWGEGTPEGSVEAPVGTIYLRTDGEAGVTLYVKEAGTDATGWDAK